MRKKRVLFVGSFKEKAKDGAVGGQMYACRSLIRSQLSNEFEWLLLDITGDTVPPPPVYVRFFAAFRRTIRFFFLCVFKRPDTVLIFTANTPSIYEKGVMALWASFCGVRVALAPRGGPLDNEIRQSKFLEKFVRYVFKHSTYIICQGTYWKQFFSLLLPPGEKDKCVIISNWIDIETYTNEHKSAVGKADIINVLFMGWIHRDKGVYDIFDAIQRLPETERKVRFTFLGDGLAMEDVKKMAASLVHKFEFEFAGWVYGAEKIKFIYESDIFILPSYSEGLPNSLMEAMACGIASIATNVGSIPDLIDNMETGIICKPGDAQGLADSLQLMISNEVLRNRLAVNGRERIKMNYSIGTAVEKFRKIL